MSRARERRRRFFLFMRGRLRGLCSRRGRREPHQLFNERSEVKRARERRRRFFLFMRGRLRGLCSRRGRREPHSIALRIPREFFKCRDELEESRLEVFFYFIEAQADRGLFGISLHPFYSGPKADVVLRPGQLEEDRNRFSYLHAGQGFTLGRRSCRESAPRSAYVDDDPLAERISRGGLRIAAQRRRKKTVYPPRVSQVMPDDAQRIRNEKDAHVLKGNDQLRLKGEDIAVSRYRTVIFLPLTNAVEVGRSKQPDIL